MATAEQVMIAIGNEIDSLKEASNHLTARMAYGAKPYPKEMSNPFLKENAEAAKKKYGHLVIDAVEKQGDGGEE